MENELKPPGPTTKPDVVGNCVLISIPPEESIFTIPIPVIPLLMTTIGWFVEGLVGSNPDGREVEDVKAPLTLTVPVTPSKVNTSSEPDKL